MWIRLFCLFSGLLLIGCQNCRHVIPQKGMQVYVAMGQSLMVGFSNNLQVDPAHPLVKMFKNGQWQPAIEPTSELPGAATSPLVAFGKEMVRANPYIQVGVINCAVGSTTLDEWLPGSCLNPNLPVCGLFEACMAKVDAAKAADPTIQIAGVLYNEGQSLAHECSAGYWAAYFPHLASDLQNHLGNIPIVFAQLGSLLEECGTGYLESVRNQQASIHAENVFMISTVDLPTTDGTHFTTEGQIIQGQRFAHVLTQAQPMVECSEPWWTRLIR